MGSDRFFHQVRTSMMAVAAMSRARQPIHVVMKAKNTPTVKAVPIMGGLPIAASCWVPDMKNQITASCQHIHPIFDSQEVL